jgi:prepilin-type N-terminal cleavage/methylation domain-containing protein
MIKNNKKGFTLLEVMLALGVITIGLMGVSSLVLQNIQVQDINKNYLVASMLAQEGLELVRNIRDTNFLKMDLGYDWKNGDLALLNNDIVRGASIGGFKEYAINYDKTIKDVTMSWSDDNTKLFFYNGIYDHNGLNGVLTPYRRLIRVYNYDYYLEVHSTVRWNEHGRTHNYEVVTDLYNWW